MNTKTTKRLGIIRLRKMHQFDQIYDFTFTAKPKSPEPSSIDEIDTIMIHYKEATHNLKGELFSVTYNQLALDQVILTILLEVQEYQSKTRKEYGLLYR